MRWEDERYVRFYTRDTPEWLALSWRARGLLGLILRAVDRAGVLAVGRLGKKGVAVAVHAPWVEIEDPLAELLEDGCVVWDEARAAFFMPNYLPAQECAQTDAARKRASREKARAMFGGGAEASEKARAALKSQPVTAHGHETGHVGVTFGHAESQSVTLSRAVLSRAVPNQLNTPHSPPQEPGGHIGTVCDSEGEEPEPPALNGNGVHEPELPNGHGTLTLPRADPPRLRKRKRPETLAQSTKYELEQQVDERSRALARALEHEPMTETQALAYANTRWPTGPPNERVVALAFEAYAMRTGAAPGGAT